MKIVSFDLLYAFWGSSLFGYFTGEWGEWGACSVTCGAGQRSRERCSKDINPGQTCPPVHVIKETEECSAAPCSSSSFQGDY